MKTTNRTNNLNTCLYCGKLAGVRFCDDTCALEFAREAADSGFRLPITDEHGRLFYTLESTDIGNSLLEAFGRKWRVSDFLGRVLPSDVGKRVYRVLTNAGDSYILQVENDLQKAVRLARGSLRD